MSKLDQIVDFLETEKTDVAVVSDPVTINYLPTNANSSCSSIQTTNPFSSFLHLKWNGRLQLSISK